MVITGRSVTIYGRRESGQSQMLACFEWNADEPEKLNVSGVPADFTDKEVDLISEEAGRFEKAVKELRKKLDKEYPY